MKNYEQYKRLLRMTFCICLLAVHGMLFWNTWREDYSPLMSQQYWRRGHLLMLAFYLFWGWLFPRIYGGWKVGYLQIFNLIYSQCLGMVLNNGLFYCLIVLLTKHIVNPMPLFWMMMVQAAVIMLWGTVSTKLYRAAYPPRKVLLVYGTYPPTGLVRKMSRRGDRFEVKEMIHIPEDFKEQNPGDSEQKENPEIKKNVQEEQRFCGKTSSQRLENLKNVREEELQKEIRKNTRTDRKEQFWESLWKRIEAYEGVVICDIPSGERNRILKYCYGKGIRCYTTPKISDLLIRSAESQHMFDTPLLLSRNTGLSIEQKFVKRVIDIVISAIALIPALPVMAVVAVFIKLEDGGSIIYKQKRLTLDGRDFYVYKFRSMREDAEKDGVARLAGENDDRITKTGHVIRAIRFDELPQLFNILSGDMSIVGPRPERPEIASEYEKEIPEFAYRLKAKAGLTGYAQVYGKYNTTAYDKLKLDLMYIENYSLKLDFEIMLKTIQILFMKESTEGMEAGQEIAITRQEEKGS